MLAQLAGQLWLAALAAAGLALVMLLAAGFHATRREYPAIGCEPRAGHSCSVRGLRPLHPRAGLDAAGGASRTNGAASRRATRDAA